MTRTKDILDISANFNFISHVHILAIINGKWRMDIQKFYGITSCLELLVYGDGYVVS